MFANPRMNFKARLAFIAGSVIFVNFNESDRVPCYVPGLGVSARRYLDGGAGVFPGRP